MTDHDITDQDLTDQLRPMLDRSYDEQPASDPFIDRVLGGLTELDQGTSRRVVRPRLPWQRSTRPTNGQHPTSNDRRNRFMIPAAAVSGVLVLALGSAFFVAQPANDESLVPAAATDATAEPSPSIMSTEPREIVEFDGGVRFGPEVDAPEVTEDRGVTSDWSETRYWKPTIIRPFSDERLRGDFYLWGNGDVFSEDGPTIWTGGSSIVNEDGAWHQAPGTILDYPDGTRAGSTNLLIGEGAYEGYYAIADFELTGQVVDIRGFIVEGDPPPAIDPPAQIRPTFEAP